MSIYRPEGEGITHAYVSDYYGGPRTLVLLPEVVVSRRNWDRPQNKAHTASVKLALATRGRPKTRGID